MQDQDPWEINYAPAAPPPATTGYTVQGLKGAEPKIQLGPVRPAGAPPAAAATADLDPWERPYQVPPKPPDPPPLVKAARAFWEGIGGQTALDILGGASRDPQRAQRAIDTVKALAGGVAAEPGRVWNELTRTGESMLKGDLSGTAFHLAGAVPFLGAPAQQVGMDVDRGDPAAAVGHTAALVAPFVAGPLAEATGRAAATTGTVARGAATGAIKAVPAAATAAVEKSFYGAFAGRAGMLAAAKLAAARELGKGAIAGAKGALAERAVTAAAEAAAEAAARETADAALAAQARATDARDAMVNPPRQLPPGPIIPPAPADASFVRSVPAEYPYVEPPMVRGAQRAGQLTPEEQALADTILQNVEPPPAPPRLALPPAPARVIVPEPPPAVPDTSFVRGVPAQLPEIIPPTLRANEPAAAAATTLRDLMQESGTAPPPEAAPAATPEPPKDFAAAARGAKSEKLADLLHKFQISASDAQRMDAEDWRQLAKAAEVPEPSETTRAQVLLQLGRRLKETIAETQQPPEAPPSPAPPPAAATIKPNVESTPTPRPVTGEQSRSAGQTVYGSRQPVAPVVSGSDVTIRVPGETTTYQGKYAVRELDDVHASHNAHTFQKNPDYYFQNDREYSNPTNKERVVVNSKADTFDPAYPLADSPDATHGAPVIDPNGNVLGGNSRAMILDRVYKNNPTGAAAYRAELARKAPGFGIDPAAIAGMKRPVLVRELAASEGNPQRAITDLNKTGTAALTAAERATADARTITPAAADYLGKAIDAEGADATLNDVLSGKSGAAIVNKLVDDGVFTMQEKPNLVDARTGSVTAAGKERISKMLLGKVFESADQLTRTPPELRAKLERVVSPILQSGQKAGFDLLPTLRQSIDLLEYARSHGITHLPDAIAQESIFGDTPKFSQEAVDLAQFLRDSKPNEVSKGFRRYVQNAEPTMFGKSSPGEAFTDAFGGAAPPEKLGELMQPPAAAARKRRSKPVR